LILTSERARKETSRVVRGRCTLACKPERVSRKKLSTLQVSQILRYLNGSDQKNTYKKEKKQSSYQKVPLQMMSCKASLVIAGS
jgi:hypothetical protein